MAKQLDTEKKQAHRRWAAQEKILEKVTASLYGMSGDLQGIAGQEIISLPELEESNDPNFAPAVKVQNIEPPKQVRTDDDDEY